RAAGRLPARGLRWADLPLVAQHPARGVRGEVFGEEGLRRGAAAADRGGARLAAGAAVLVITGLPVADRRAACALAAVISALSLHAGHAVITVDPDVLRSNKHTLPPLASTVRAGVLGVAGDALADGHLPATYTLRARALEAVAVEHAAVGRSAVDA